MRTDVAADPEDGISPDRVRAWLSEVLDAQLTAITVQRLAGGHSSGAWRIDATADGRMHSVVLKAPELPSVVYQRDAGREARIMAASHRHGAPVPNVLAIDDGTRAVGRPCFLMEYVPGRSVADGSAAGPHDDAELRNAGPAGQRAVWESFHDSLAALHSVDADEVPDARLGDGGVADVLDYWRAALVDVLDAEAVPRHLAVLDWLRDHLPPDADDAPAVCLGDARLVNGIVIGTEVRALVDFEVAYVGNPMADVAYSLFLDGLQHRAADQPLALPSPDETWTRWSHATGRSIADRDYWTAFGITIICITATRALIQWGLSDGPVESQNPLVSEWESAVERAAR